MVPQHHHAEWTRNDLCDFHFLSVGCILQRWAWVHPMLLGPFGCPTFSHQSSPTQDGATISLTLWLLNEHNMIFVIFTFRVLDASCKGVPGCIQCCLGHLVAQLFPPKFSSSKCATASSPLWVLNEQKMTFEFFTLWVLDASCKGVPGCIQCCLGHLVAQHFLNKVL